MTKIDNRNFRSWKPIMPNWDFLKLVFKLVVPIIISQIVLTMVNFIDNFIVGHTTNNETNLSGVAIANELWYFAFGVIGAISVGTSIFMAQFLGAGKIDIFKKLQKNMIGINLIFMAIFTILANTIPDKLMGIYTSDVEIQHAGSHFLRWVIADLLFVSVSYTLQTSFNIMGKTKYVLISAFVALINNGVMGYLLIYEADLGTAGAGIANFVSRFFEISIMIFFAFKNKQHINWDLNFFKFEIKQLKLVMQKWFYMFAYVAFMFSLVALSAVWSNYYDKEVVAAIGTGYAVSNIMWTIFPAIGAASKNLIGKELGKSNFKQALSNSRQLNVSMTFIALIFSIIAVGVSFFLPHLVGLNGRSQDVARDMILIFAGSNVFYVLAAVLFAPVEAGGIVMPSTITSNFFQLVIVWPLAILLAIFTRMEFWQVFLITQAVQIIPALSGYYFYRQFKWLRNIAAN